MLILTTFHTPLIFITKRIKIFIAKTNIRFPLFINLFRQCLFTPWAANTESS